MKTQPVSVQPVRIKEKESDEVLQYKRERGGKTNKWAPLHVMPIIDFNFLCTLCILQSLPLSPRHLHDDLVHSVTSAHSTYPGRHRALYLLSSHYIHHGAILLRPPVQLHGLHVLLSKLPTAEDQQPKFQASTFVGRGKDTR
jgi:hypothetical protein